MAYSGTLLRFGDWNIPLKYISLNTYKITYNSQDIDSTRNANGYLERNGLEHKVVKVEFEIPYCYGNTIADFMNNLKRNYTNSIEKKGVLRFFNHETQLYEEQEVYVPDISFQIYNIDEKTNEIKYAPTRVAFIGY